MNIYLYCGAWRMAVTACSKMTFGFHLSGLTHNKVPYVPRKNNASLMGISQHQHVSQNKTAHRLSEETYFVKQRQHAKKKTKVLIRLL